MIDEHDGSDADAKERIGKAKASYSQLKEILNSKQLSVDQQQFKNFQSKCQGSSTTLIRIWDVFLLEGSETLFRFAVAILKRNQDMLLEQSDTISFWKCLKAATRLTNDVDGLIKTAFEELRPFPKPQLIATRRAYHYEILSKKMSIKKGYWQNVMKESPDEFIENQNHIQYKRSTKENQAVIQAITFYDNEHLWICHGDKSYSQISEVVVTSNCMQSIGYEFDIMFTYERLFLD
ncbi:unnamed protein product [Schistosoma curassoni]|uniref:Rab-GAP TBC domain-containing protein n=1 Tax=Schistosoma curassoni TaxID=6186 RepID=A0A183K665_9TREM|nr:unnamed protein product [Schistosoma curassoni]